jgi:protein-S-isoprenylcysteine O-methyltransferase Ste14
VTLAIFAIGFLAGAVLNLLLLRTLFDPAFHLWPSPEPGSWQSLTFWSLFRGGVTLALAVAVLDWNSVHLFDWPRLLIGLPMFFVGFGIAVAGYFDLGLGNTYGGSDGLVTGGLYRYSRNPQYIASIVGLIGLAIAANSILTIVLSAMMIGAYVLMALTEESWLEKHYGPSYRDYMLRTARFFDFGRLLRDAGRKLTRADENS